MPLFMAACLCLHHEPHHAIVTNLSISDLLMWSDTRNSCSVLRCAAVCCSVLQCVAMCCSVLQCVAVLITRAGILNVLQYAAFCVCGAVSCNVVKCVAVYCSVLQCVAVCYSVLQCVAVCCSVV